MGTIDVPTRTGIGCRDQPKNMQFGENMKLLLALIFLPRQVFIIYLPFQKVKSLLPLVTEGSQHHADGGVVA